MKFESAISDQASVAARGFLKWLVFLFPLPVLAAFLILKVDSPETYYLLIREDSIIEDAQAVFYFFSAIICLHVSVKFLQNKQIAHAFLSGMLSTLFLFFSLEEISWGQRILNIETGGYFALHNVQYETTFHNLDIFQPLLHTAFSLAGIYGAFAWVFVRRFVSNSGSKAGNLLKCLVPEWFVSSYFILCTFIYLLLSYLAALDPEKGLGRLIGNDFFFWMDLEIGELFLSLGFVLFAMTNFIRCPKSISPGVAEALRN